MGQEKVTSADKPTKVAATPAANYSSKIMAMRFMQREVEKERSNELEKIEKKRITEAHWELKPPAALSKKPMVKVQYEPNFLNLTQEATTGRRSFNMQKAEAPKPVEVVETEAKRTPGRYMSVGQPRSKDPKRSNKQEDGQSAHSKKPKH
ncbi:hypothetical protein H4R33_002261 [Dimargaris cristalligena]|uniref:Uncharacterized protein n=1 Tax=Dimargaris cristalligena TaxID=215637 RepID=A0A4Q0A0J5_9FUNG|nr:hypothetical protein H4R33_002261 [Dimargaris cristalligena]RKP39565.1 hypothetical protein BJ085DRAFT_31242 [Dimargaris cristalligena]|eukprot:RKP39565.1 hypothetical protein BJ085DRAFT_31242 [Dimargaris cristalligena]